MANYNSDGLVYSVYDSTAESIIQRKIEGIQRLINPQYGNMTPEEEEAALIEINPAMKNTGNLR
jgi:hypothetical protein